jgi:hypothetical protein
MRYIQNIKMYYEYQGRFQMTEEDLLRELAVKIIRDIPISELSRIIHFRKTDPLSKAVQDKIKDWKTSDEERLFLMSLHREMVILYEAELKL